jgi:hypothetical protein
VTAPAPETYVTELAVPEPVTVLQVLHSRMLEPEPEPEPELEAEAGA